MVYKIRHKGFWEFRPGNRHYDRNFHNFIKELDTPKQQTIFITHKNQSYFAFRYLHQYRVIKRAANQYFQGNELLQNAFTLALRTMYTSVPKEMWLERYGGPDMLVHKAERHWELMTYNQHPLQHDIYEMFNKYSHDHHAQKTEDEEAEAHNFVEKVNELVKAKREELGLKDYQNLELSELQDAFDEAMKDLRNNPGSDSYVMSAEDKEKEIDAENPRRVSFFH